MIKKIIALSDVHFRNVRRLNESTEFINNVTSAIKSEIKGFKKDEVRIVIAGDIFHNKLDISCEAYMLAAKMLTVFDGICKTYIIAGNHDLNMSNLTRLDPITTVFNMCKFKNTIYLDSECDYTSTCLVDDNVVWCLYSTFNDLSRPDIESFRLEHTDKAFIGLYHGMVRSCKTDVGFVSMSGAEPSLFEGLDLCIAGDIHKHQLIKMNGVPFVYCGSVMQQNFGENVSGHGIVSFDITPDVENGEYLTDFKLIEIPNPNYGFYNFSINSKDDLDNDLEELTNG